MANIIGTRFIFTLTSFSLISCLRGEVMMVKKVDISSGKSSTRSERSVTWNQAKEFELEAETPYDETAALIRHLNEPIDPEEPIVQMPLDYFQKKPRWSETNERAPYIHRHRGQGIEKEQFEDGIFLSRRELMKRRLNSFRVSKIFPDVHPKPPRAQDVLFPEDVNLMNKEIPTVRSGTTVLTTETTQGTTPTRGSNKTPSTTSTRAPDKPPSTTSTQAPDKPPSTTPTQAPDKTLSTTSARASETTTMSTPKSETTTFPESMQKGRDDGGFFKWPPSWWPFSFFASPKEPQQIHSTTATISTTSASTNTETSISNQSLPSSQMKAEDEKRVPHSLSFIPVSMPSLPSRDARPNQIWFLREQSSMDMPMPYFRHFHQNQMQRQESSLPRITSNWEKGGQSKPAITLETLNLRENQTGNPQDRRNVGTRQSGEALMKFRFENRNLPPQDKTSNEGNCTKVLPDGSQALPNGVVVPPGFKCPITK